MGALLGGRDKNAVHSVRGSRLTVSIVIGILVGGIFAVFYPHGFLSWNHPSQFQSRRLTTSIVQIESLSSEPVEGVNTLGSDVADLSSKIDELTKHVTDLTAKLMAAEQKNGKAEHQVVGTPQKAGPFGSVKGIRTNPSIIPDDTLNPRLAKILKQIAVQNELIVTISNSYIKPMLKVWFTSIKKVGITNYLVVALDDGIVDFCEENDVPVYKRDPDESIDSINSGSNRPVTGLKFRILREFLQLGYSVLLSDVDIVYIQNPFDHIYRDSDIESMSNGDNNMTAYGYNDVSDDPPMGWGRYAHTIRIWGYNSGFFYLRPTLPAIELLDRVAEKLPRFPAVWDDEAVFNEELFFPSYPGYIGLHVSKRTMDRYLFMNSKVLFTEVRKDSQLKKLKPVVVHMNYHPDKIQRMEAIVEFYFNGKEDALDTFPDGSAIYFPLIV